MSCNDELATNYELIGTSAGVAAVVLTIIIIYFVKIRHQSPPIFLIIALLLINTLLVLLFEAIGYIQHLEEALCTVSLIGMTAFTIAASNPAPMQISGWS